MDKETFECAEFKDIENKAHSNRPECHAQRAT